MLGGIHCNDIDQGERLDQPAVETSDEGGGEQSRVRGGDSI
jgi:hypothetical protein